MSKRKADYRIGIRMHEEITRLWPNKSYNEISRTFGCDRKSIFGWRDGCATPSVFFLARAIHYGADANYILTGRRRESL